MAAVVDPGGDLVAIKKKLFDLNASCRLILLTHGHYDHILAVDGLRNKNTEVCIHEKDAHYLKEHDFFSTLIQNDPRPFQDAEILISSEGKYSVDEFDFQVLHTPGHTDGSVCYIFEDCMFTGDTLFKNSIGTTVFGGNEEVLFESLKRLYNYPGDYGVYPGHEQETALSDERIYNPFLQQFRK